LGAIYHLRKISKVTLTQRHVKGHQDDHSEDLDQWARLNVKMDEHAKHFLLQASLSPRPYDIKKTMAALGQWLKNYQRDSKTPL